MNTTTYEIVDGLENLWGDTLTIWADLNTAQYIEECAAYLTDDEGKKVITGTYDSVVTWAYRHGYQF